MGRARCLLLVMIQSPHVGQCHWEQGTKANGSRGNALLTC
jgi:hypothetical protein